MKKKSIYISEEAYTLLKGASETVDQPMSILLDRVIKAYYKILDAESEFYNTK